jgi:predicted nucleic acid-binding protein
LSEPFVLDASVALSWAFTEEANSFTEQVLKSLETAHATVPALWPFEVINILAAAERQSRLTIVQQSEFLEKLRACQLRSSVVPQLGLLNKLCP